MLNFCPVCSNNKFNNIFSSDNIPEYNLNYLNNIYESLNYKKTKVKFVECKFCGFLFNKVYKQLSYEVEYNANRSFSKIFDNYLDNVIKYLDDIIFKKYELNTILEIGHGDAKFLEKIINLKKYKFKKIIGYDPSSIKHYKINKKIKLYNSTYSQKNSVKPDLLILRHTLEHISDVKNFLDVILHENPKFLFIEVPCKSFAIKNIHYFSNEHCSYFDKNTIELLLSKFNYQKLSFIKLFNNENLLCIFIKSDVNKKFRYKLNHTKKRFYDFKIEKDKFFKKFNLKYDFLWGASGKGVMLLNSLKITYKSIPRIIDINKNIQGKFIPICGTEIISQNNLPKYVHKNSKIFITNKVYKNEVISILKLLKLNNKVLSI